MQCTNFDKKATTVKSRIQNIGILFGKAQIHQDNNLVLYNIESNYKHSTINYVYYVHPYNYRKIKYDSFKIDIPQYNEYLSFINLCNNQNYKNLLGLIIFANEGIYFFHFDESNKYKIDYHIHPDYMSFGSKGIKKRIIEEGVLFEIFSYNDIKSFFSSIKKFG